MSQAKRPNPRTPKADVGDRSDRAATTSDSVAGRKRPRAPSWEREYQQIWKTVNDLGAEQFTGKDKRAYEARKIVERGGRVRALARLDCIGAAVKPVSNSVLYRACVASRRCSGSTCCCECLKCNRYNGRELRRHH